MKKGFILYLLLGYYGVLQLVHFSMNFVIIFFDPSLLTQASPVLTSFQAHYFMISSFADFFLASPLGILGVGLLYWGNKKLGLLFTSMSLGVAWLSAIFYVLLLLVFQAFVFNATTIIFGILFLPIIALTFLFFFNKKFISF